MPRMRLLKTLSIVITSFYLGSWYTVITIPYQPVEHQSRQHFKQVSEHVTPVVEATFAPTEFRVKRSKREAVLYNLLEETAAAVQNLTDCSLEYANSHRLQQDHPCVLDLIRRHYLTTPSPPEVPLNLDYPNRTNPSAGQVTAALRLLRNLTGGFYVESGAADGETLSNTLFLERYMNWTGLLIEPEPLSYKKLMKRNRKSFTFNNCLSLEKYPTEVSFDRTEIEGRIRGEKVSQSKLKSGKVVNVQCFPLYSILLAHGRTNIDVFVLDVEGHELKVLKTIPWDKVRIKILFVEWEWVEEGYQAIADFMETQGYVTFGDIATPYARDVVFVEDYLRDLRFAYVDAKEYPTYSPFND